jgi:hypothetical protein
MDQEQPVNAESLPDSTSPSSLLSRVTDVFAAPGDLFAEVAVAPVQKSSWIVPYVLSLILAVVVTFSIYNNASLRQQIFDMQEQGMKKAVAEGKMTQEQYDQVSERMESSGPVMFMTIGAGSAVVLLTVVFFGATLIVWLTAKFAMAFTGSYGKMLEVYGLATIIGILGAIAAVLLMNVFDSMHAQPGAGLLLMNSFDATNVSHRFLASINVFTLWQVGVLGIGVAKVSRSPVGKGVGIIFTLWLVWAIVSSLMGWGVK